ncbi:MAG: ABC transporter substrate-binding protein [Proteobacteria bacterium]|nr:ABC transporter substrate-binding protein [Pseudomonadota bacterium]
MTRRFRTAIVTILVLATLCIGAARCHAGQDLVLGMSAAFTGPTRDLGLELYRGAQAYFDKVNQSGGVLGNRISILPLDDAYDPHRCQNNTVTFIQRTQVFALFNYVGTPTSTQVLPLLKRYADRNMLLLFPLTGAEPLRRRPYVDKIYNLRASYNDEARALVNNFLDAGREKIAVLYQADAFGRNGWDGIRQALASRHLGMVAEASYHRGAVFGDDMTPQVDILKHQEPQAVVCVGTSAACAAFIRDAHTQGLDVPIATLSFANPQTMLELLKNQKQPEHRYKNIIASLAVPCHKDRSLAAVQEFQELMKTTPPPPPGLTDAPYSSPDFSPVAFEGFLNAKVLVQALERIGPHPNRTALALALEDPQGFDLGLGHRVAFSQDRHQALSTVYFVSLDDGQLAPIQDFRRCRP